MLPIDKYPAKPTEIVIMSVPHCEPYPMVAPVLLSSCLNTAGISAQGVDFAAIFSAQFGHEPWYGKFRNFLTFSHMTESRPDRKILKLIYKFTKHFLKELVTRWNPSAIGISIFSTDSLDFGIFISYMIRRHHRGLKIIAGGKGLEVTHQNNEKHYSIWAKHHIADLIIVGDAESELIESIKLNKLGLVFARSQTASDLDAMPLANWKDYDLGIYDSISNLANTSEPNQEPYISITASKGCVRKCTFCDVAEFWPKFIYRDPVKVAEEMIHNYEHTKIKVFKFTDNLINGSISNYNVMNQVLAERLPRTISYSGYAIFRNKNQLKEHHFKLAATAGCTLWSIGIESGSEKIRHQMKKKFSDDDIDWSANMLSRYGIKQTWLFMVGYPSETEFDFALTKKLLKKFQRLGINQEITLVITPTFSLNRNSPLLDDDRMAREYGVEHNLDINKPGSEKFWTSTKYIDNDYPTRSRRWKELTAYAQDLGYGFARGMTMSKFIAEIEALDEFYKIPHNKIIPIRASV